MYDLIIIGASAAGCAASIYAARRNLNFKIISKDIGGEVLTSGDIDNYLGFVNTDGFELTNKFKEHLKSYNIEVEENEVLAIENKEFSKNENIFIVKTGKNEYKTKSVILATGAHPRKLNIKGEDNFKGKGITYCTVCDGPLFKNKITATIGGGNSGLESALMMERIASKVYLLEREDKLKGDDILIEKAKSSNKIEIITGVEATEIKGNAMVNAFKYKDIKTGEIKELKAEGVMVHIGSIPNSKIAPDSVNKNEFNEILIDSYSKTNAPGFFAAGDVTSIAYRQISIAAGQGVCAALSAVEYLNKLKV